MLRLFLLVFFSVALAACSFPTSSADTKVTGKVALVALNPAQGYASSGIKPLPTPYPANPGTINGQITGTREINNTATQLTAQTNGTYPYYSDTRW